MRNFVLTVLSLFVFLTPALAQTDRATLTGAVNDPRGAVVRGANGSTPPHLLNRQVERGQLQPYQ
jgi:hypothetical protein